MCGYWETFIRFPIHSPYIYRLVVWLSIQDRATAFPSSPAGPLNVSTRRTVYLYTYIYYIFTIFSRFTIFLIFVDFWSCSIKAVYTSGQACGKSARALLIQLVFVRLKNTGDVGEGTFRSYCRKTEPSNMSRPACFHVKSYACVRACICMMRVSMVYEYTCILYTHMGVH